MSTLKSQLIEYDQQHELLRQCTIPGLLIIKIDELQRLYAQDGWHLGPIVNEVATPNSSHGTR
jgi:hypothetical protein